jgi:NADPH:quinone reductase-like Zn-dependent oxidoreductase
VGNAGAQHGQHGRVRRRASRQIAPAPKNLTPVQAISLLVGGTTAVTALREKAAVRPGERLLVRGGSGGVGSAVVQIGKLLGADVVALAGAKSLDFVRGLGADEALDYRTTSLSELGRFDVVVDTVGTRLSSLRTLLAPGGRMVAVTLDFDRLFAGFATVLGSAVHGRGRIRAFSGNPGTESLSRITRYAERGDIVPVVDAVHPLDRLADAHLALEAGGVHGKHVIQIT